MKSHRRKATAAHTRPRQGPVPVVGTRLGAYACLLAVAAVALVLWQPQSVLAATPDDRWEHTIAEIRKAFPDVPHLTTQELAILLATEASVLLIDARTVEEFQVSHLAGAVRSTTVRTTLKAIESHAGNLTIVVYCSVGYRSSRLVSKLQARGVANVFNLEGSLFRWANEGRPLVRGDEPVAQVHPYDDDWAALLQAPLRVAD